MRWALKLAAAGLLALVAAAPATAQGGKPPFAPGDGSPEDLPAGPGRDETFYTCTACHNFKLVAAQGMMRPQWDDSLTWMTERHKMPDIQGADRDLILDYLAKNYPPRAPSRAGGFKNPFAPE